MGWGDVVVERDKAPLMVRDLYTVRVARFGGEMERRRTVASRLGETHRFGGVCGSVAHDLAVAGMEGWKSVVDAESRIYWNGKNKEKEVKDERIYNGVKREDAP